MKENKMLCAGTLEIIDLKTGKTIFSGHNKFTQVGLNEIAKFVGKKGGTAPSHMAVGTGNTAPQLGDTALKGSELARVAFDSVEVTGSTVKFTATFGAGVATGTWEETGIFTADSAGIMYSRSVTGIYT